MSGGKVEGEDLGEVGACIHVHVYYIHTHTRYVGVEVHVYTCVIELMFYVSKSVLSSQATTPINQNNVAYVRNKTIGAVRRIKTLETMWWGGEQLGS